MLFRRIKYALTGKLMRGAGAIFKLVIVCVLVIICLSGVFSQKQVFLNVASWFKDTGYVVADKFKNVLNGNGSNISITDEGVYLKGHEKGNEIDMGETTLDPKTKEDSVIDKVIGNNSNTENSTEEQPENNSEENSTE